MIVATRTPHHTIEPDELAADVAFLRERAEQAFADGVDVAADDAYLPALRQLEAEGVLRFERFDEYSFKLLPCGGDE